MENLLGCFLELRRARNGSGLAELGGLAQKVQSLALYVTLVFLRQNSIGLHNLLQASDHKISLQVGQ